VAKATACLKARRLFATFRVPFSMTISFNHPFSRRKSPTSRSSSSARPVKSETVRSRAIVLCFFLVRKRAMPTKITTRLSAYDKSTFVPEAAVFLRLFSSDAAARSASVNSTSGELELCEATVDARAC